jgi:hypothetical protein
LGRRRQASSSPTVGEWCGAVWRGGGGGGTRRAERHGAALKMKNGCALGREEKESPIFKSPYIHWLTDEYKVMFVDFKIDKYNLNIFVGQI